MDESLLVALRTVIEWLDRHLYYIEGWLAQFAEALEQPEIVTQYQTIQAHVATAADFDGEETYD